MEYLDTKRVRPRRSDALVVVDDPTLPVKHAMYDRFTRRPVIEWSVASEPHRYFPLENKPALYQYFSRLGGEDQVADFFRTYGPLFTGDAKVGDTVRESVLRWQAEILHMRAAMDDLTSYAEEDVDLFSDDEPIGRELRGLVNHGLRNNTYPVVLKGGIRIAPSNLLGAMWLMFVREATGEVVIRACDYCHTLIPLSPTSAKRGKRFCSDACRLKAHRESKGGESK